MTLSPADSPANQSASPEPEKPKTTRGGSGPSSSESFAWYDPDTLSWKTSQVSLLPEWETFSETWPRSGMTVSGKAFRQRLLVPRIYGGGSSLWPTPVTFDHRDPNKPEVIAAKAAGETRYGLELRDAVQLLHTPTATATAPSMRAKPGGWFWPTPMADDAYQWSSESAQRRIQAGHQRDLTTAVPGQLNPMWVEWLMGFPEGWTDLEDSATP